MEQSTYHGDETYSVNTTGDCVVGDEVCFERATFTGSYRNAKFAGMELVEGKIIRESYGSYRGQHTFTIQKSDGSTMRIKGRNLYSNGTWRKLWADESERDTVCDEKHARGDRARAAREEVRCHV